MSGEFSFKNDKSKDALKNARSSRTHHLLEWGQYLRGETSDLSDEALLAVNDRSVRDTIVLWLTPGWVRDEEGESPETRGEPGFLAMGDRPYNEADVMDDDNVIEPPLTRVRRLGIEITSDKSKRDLPQWIEANAGLVTVVVTTLYYAGHTDGAKHILHLAMRDGRKMGTHAETLETMERLMEVAPKSDLVLLKEMLDAKP